MTYVMSLVSTSEHESARAGEFEFVLGSTQFTSLGLAVLTLVALCATGAYMVGKNTGKIVEVRVPFVPAVSAPPPIEPSRVVPPPEPPIEGIPEDGRPYIQLGSVERGFAMLMTQGLRKQGMPALMAPGISPTVFRVLAGPFENEKELEQARTGLAEIGLKMFVRRYPEPAPSLP